MTKRKRRLNAKIKAASAAAARQGINPTTHPDAAGIDIGAEELVAAVPPGRGTGDTVRTFSSFTSGVEALRDWLLECGIKTAAVESTGNYWSTRAMSKACPARRPTCATRNGSSSSTPPGC
jgi:hypothetical protein